MTTITKPMTWRETMAAGLTLHDLTDAERVIYQLDLSMATWNRKLKALDKPGGICRTCFGRGAGTGAARYTECMDCGGDGQTGE